MNDYTETTIPKLGYSLAKFGYSSLFDYTETTIKNSQIFWGYAIYICRVLKEVEGVENELVELKNHVLTQKKLVKELVDGINLEFL